MSEKNKQNQPSNNGQDVSFMECVEETAENITVDEGREVMDEDGVPSAGYSAYGLCVKASRSNNDQT